MSLDISVEDQLRQFLRESRFSSHGGVITDFDGTAVHEDSGRLRTHLHTVLEATNRSAEPVSVQAARGSDINL